MGQVMGEIVQSVHHDGEQTVPVVRLDFIEISKSVHCFGSKWSEFCIGSRSLPSTMPQIILQVREVLFVRKRQDDTAGLGSRRVE